MRAVADRERFLATMSHEIRTPMNAILGTAYLLPTTTRSDQQREYVADEAEDELTSQAA